MCRRRRRRSSCFSGSGGCWSSASSPVDAEDLQDLPDALEAQLEARLGLHVVGVLLPPDLVHLCPLHREGPEFHLQLLHVFLDPGGLGG